MAVLEQERGPQGEGPGDTCLKDSFLVMSKEGVLSQPGGGCPYPVLSSGGGPRPNLGFRFLVVQAPSLDLKATQEPRVPGPCLTWSLGFESPELQGGGSQKGVPPR